MKKLNNIKWFLLGIIVTLLVTLSVMPALATQMRQVQATLTYRDIRVTIDGQQINLAAEPFIIDGSTYLPLRGIGQALGLGVGWDGDTSTVMLTTAASAPEPEPPAPSARSFSGTGDSVVSGINLPAGNYYARSTHDGSSNFIVYFYYGEGEQDWSLVANTIGKSSGERLLGDTLGVAVSDGVLEVRADGDWTIEILEVAGTITSPVSGNGDAVTGLITGFSGRRTITVTHNGSSNIIVYMYTHGGGSRAWQLVGNDIGISAGERVANFTSNERYFFSVQADGDWMITIN